MTFTSCCVVKKKRPAVAYSTAGLLTALDETLCYVMTRRRMTPVTVPVRVHMVVHVLIMVPEIIRRRKFIIEKLPFVAVAYEGNIADSRPVCQGEINDN
jgi:hypothetical protein